MGLPSVDPGAVDRKVDAPSVSSQEEKPHINTDCVCHPHSVSPWRVRALSLATTSAAADLASMGQAAPGVCNYAEGQEGVLQAGLIGGGHLGKKGRLG